MEEIVIEAEPREAASTNAARRLRRQGKLPAVLYGGGRAPRPIAVEPAAVLDVLKSGQGENTILKLKVGGEAPETVMIYEYQIDPVSRRLLHADFIRIALDQSVEVEVPIVLVGEARGVRVDGGVLDHTLRDLDIECLPADIPEHIELDVSDLGVHGVIRVADLPLPAGIRVLADPGQVVVSVLPPTVEEEVEVPVAEPFAEAAEPEVIRRERAAEEAEEAPEAPSEAAEPE